VLHNYSMRAPDRFFTQLQLAAVFLISPYAEGIIEMSLSGQAGMIIPVHIFVRHLVSQIADAIFCSP